ncbi:MAG: hypothetical protein ACREDU_11715, partial [Methylocella sp.]
MFKPFQSFKPFKSFLQGSLYQNRESLCKLDFTSGRVSSYVSKKLESSQRRLVMVTAKDVQGVMAMMPAFSTKDAG